jgi:hypothetical protein
METLNKVLRLYLERVIAMGLYQPIIMLAHPLPPQEQLAIHAVSKWRTPKLLILGFVVCKPKRKVVQWVLLRIMENATKIALRLLVVERIPL